MKDDAAAIKVLVRVPTEMESALIVGALAEQGIEAKAVGSYTQRFRAEAPGDVAVVVRAEDLLQARRIVSGLRNEMSQVDWSQVDVGEPE